MSGIRKWSLRSTGPRKKNSPPWLATVSEIKNIPPGLIQMLLLLDLLLLLLLHVFDHVLIGGREAPTYDYIANAYS